MDLFDYKRMMRRAFQGVVRDTLSDLVIAAENGTQGEHHIYLTFRTDAEGVEAPDWLLQQYAGELTVVLGHEFYELTPEETGFTVTLTFNDRPATISVPYDALASFADPSANFGLKLDQDEVAEPDAPDPAPEAEPEPPSGPAEVVSLDRFRKPDD